MVLKTVELSLRQRAPVVLLTLILIGVGVWSAMRLPIDSVPDITNPQVLLNTAVPALAPEEIEKLVTLNIESQMAGLPGMIELRSLSKFGLSQVRMTFEDGVELYRTRQLVAERLLSVADKLPPGLQPRLAPISTALGEIFYYSVEFTKGGAGDPPAPFGDSPNGTSAGPGCEVASTPALAVPPSESPGETGQWPVLPSLNPAASLGIISRQ